MEETRVLQHMPRNLWRTWGKMNFPLSGLQFYLPCGHPELSGSPIISKDLSASSCTVVGAVHTPPLGRLFDGNDDSIALPAAIRAYISHELDFSIVMWASSDLSDEQYYFASSISSADMFSIESVSNSIRVAIYKDTAYVGARSMALTTGMHFIVYTFTAATNTGRLSLDLAPSTGTTATACDITVATYIGRRTGVTRSLAGYIGEVWIYSRAIAVLEDQQIKLPTQWRYL